MDASSPRVDEFRAYRIHAGRDSHRAGIETLCVDDLSPGDVVVRARWSGINYKDALAGSGKGKILRRSPLVGGIDVAGTVVATQDARFREGDEVLVTGSGLSETRDGGYAEYVRLDAANVVPLPRGLDAREAMILGTAGFTAALALYRLQANGQSPELGPIVVTGATGGVGTIAIDLLTRVGYEVHAISGKPDQFDFLASLGAQQCVSRHGLVYGQRPLETATWAGAIDNVGGETLSGLTRMIRPYGSIASCGLAGGAELHTTVMPFILRGVSLLGVATTEVPFPLRRLLWDHLATDWKPAHLERIATAEVSLSELEGVFARMLSGSSLGRTLVRL